MRIWYSKSSIYCRLCLKSKLFHLFCRIPVETLRSWESSFSALLAHADGIRLFENYLKSEFSEENIQFWKACERFKTLPDHHIEKEAAVIYDEYIDPQASKLVSNKTVRCANGSACVAS